MNRASPGHEAGQLSVIYYALATGVLLYALVVLLVLRPVGGAVGTTTMRVIWLGVAVAATLGVGVVRGRSQAGRGAAGRAATPIVVWALAEGQALVAITGTLLTGERMLSFAGLAVFVWLWLRYPPRSFGGG